MDGLATRVACAAVCGPPGSRVVATGVIQRPSLGSGRCRVSLCRVGAFSRLSICQAAICDKRETPSSSCKQSADQWMTDIRPHSSSTPVIALPVHVGSKHRAPRPPAAYSAPRASIHAEFDIATRSLPPAGGKEYTVGLHSIGRRWLCQSVVSTRRGYDGHLRKQVESAWMSISDQLTTGHLRRRKSFDPSRGAVPSRETIYSPYRQR